MLSEQSKKLINEIAKKSKPQTAKKPYFLRCVMMKIIVTII